MHPDNIGKQFKPLVGPTVNREAVMRESYSGIDKVMFDTNVPFATKKTVMDLAYKRINQVRKTL
jgi:hypothetical protein